MQTSPAGDIRAVPPAPLDFDAPQSTIDVGHSRLAYWRTGRGPDVIFVHGWPLRAATFRHVAALLADAFTCHLVDLPGAGATTSGPEARYDLHAHADTIRAAADKLGLSRYALVAHDSGGFIARLVAAADPRVAALVLGNTEIPDHTPALIKVFVLLARAGLAGPMLRLLVGSRRMRRSALAFGNCFTDRDFVEGEFRTLFIEPLRRSPAVLAGQLRLLLTLAPEDVAGLGDVHARISAPVALVWGTDDTWFPLAKARPMLAGFGGPAALTEIAGGKLFVHEDHAAEFAGAAREHLIAALSR